MSVTGHQRQHLRIDPHAPWRKIMEEDRYALRLLASPRLRDILCMLRLCAITACVHRCVIVVHDVRVVLWVVLSGVSMPAYTSYLEADGVSVLQRRTAVCRPAAALVVATHGVARWRLWWSQAWALYCAVPRRCEIRII